MIDKKLITKTWKSYLKFLVSDPADLSWVPIGLTSVSILELIFFILSKIDKTEMVVKWLLYNPYIKKEIWRFLTYTLVHENVRYVNSNISIQILFGIPLEVAHTWWKILLIYFVGILSGSLVSGLTNPTQTLIGSSGGIFAIITSYIPSIVVNRKRISYAKSKLIALICLLLVLCTLEFTSNVDENISLFVHNAGIFAGISLGFFILNESEKSKVQIVLKYLFLIFSIVSIITLVVLNVIVSIKNKPKV